MTGMSMPRQEWYLALPGYLRMWLLMMVPMMLPSLVPMVSRYRRSVPGGGLRRHGLTALVGLGLLRGVGRAGRGCVWRIRRCHAAGDRVGGRQGRWLPGAAGVTLLVAGVAQLTTWKARQLAPPARGEPGDDCHVGATGSSAFRHGLELGLGCSRSCGPLMLALLGTGMMEPLALAAGTLAITAERLAPAPLRVVRAVGLAMLVGGVMTMARG